MSPTQNPHHCYVATTNDMENDDLVDDSTDEDSETLSIPELASSGEDQSGHNLNFESLYWSPRIDRHRYAESRAIGESNLNRHLIEIFDNAVNPRAERQRLLMYVTKDYTFMSLPNYQSDYDSDSSEASTQLSANHSNVYCWKSLLIIGLAVVHLLLAIFVVLDYHIENLCRHFSHK